jgi:hypothetical protein
MAPMRPAATPRSATGLPAKVSHVVMDGNLTTRQQVLELEPMQVCKPTRLGEGECVALKQEDGDLLAQFRLRYPR